MKIVEIKDKNLIMIPGSVDANNGTGILEFDKTNDYYNQLAQRYTYPLYTSDAAEDLLCDDSCCRGLHT